MGDTEILREVAETLEEIRQSSETNMADRKAVQYLADKRDEHETVIWLEENREKYAEVLTTWD